MSEATGWHSRGYLPHFDQAGVIQMITFRLADALPAARLDALERDPDVRADAERRRRLEAYLDAGHGACHLRNPRIAQLVESALWHFDGSRYRLQAWVVMPNHVHVLIEPIADHPISIVVQTWKSFTAREANVFLGRKGRFWQPDYFDRTIRDERHIEAAIRYIHDNPVKAGLATEPGAWPHSSAARDLRCTSRARTTPPSG